MATRVGTLGDDTLVGVKGEPNDLWGDTMGTLSGGSGGSGGNDILIGGANSTDNHLYGDANAIMGMAAEGGDDTLTGGAYQLPLW
jgi:hypothetical protein